MNGDENGKGMSWPLVAVLLILAAGGITSLILDAPRSWLSFHVAFDLLMIAAALAAVTGLWIAWRRAERSADGLRRSLEEGKADRDAWRVSARLALEGLAEAIDRQFDLWGLTPAEREVALLLLKGHSHKRIALGTDRSEHTVRQHAGVTYQKAGVAGRAELAAFFLEGLMLPQRERERRRGSGEPCSMPGDVAPGAAGPVLRGSADGSISTG